MLTPTSVLPEKPSEGNFPRYFENGNSIIRLDNSTERGWWISGVSDKPYPQQSTFVNLYYLTRVASSKLWRELTPTEALAKTKGDKSNE